MVALESLRIVDPWVAVTDNIAWAHLLTKSDVRKCDSENATVDLLQFYSYTGEMAK